VIYLEPVDLSVTAFSLRPEHFLDKMLSAFGFQDIDFGQRPEFSRRYRLRGQDEGAIRQTFNDRVLAFFETYPNTCVDAGRNQVILFRSGYRCRGDEIQGYVGLGLQVVNLLRGY
jgi:hypothetical protein